MRIHYSTISQYEKCPYQYKLRYVDKLETIFDCEPANALVIGTALHRGIETDVETAIDEYYSTYPIISDENITEAMKLEYWIPKVKALLPQGQHEVNFKTDDYEGTIDLLVPISLSSEEMDDICRECDKEESCEYCSSGHCPYGKFEFYYDIYDFKYSNNIKNYMESPQLHLYKYFFEQANPDKHIHKLYFVFVPKCNLRIKHKNKTNTRDETLFEFRKRCISDLEQKEIQIKEVTYNPVKVSEFLRWALGCQKDNTFEKNPTRLCDWCNYKDYCQKGHDYMLLPSIKRRDISISEKKKLWLYAPPFSGKTTLTDKFPDPLILTTDGNIHNVTAPYIYIKDEVTLNGRAVNRKFAWEVFKEVITELEKKDNDFKTISLDLVEDTREMCRLYMYDKLGIQHESDSAFSKGWDIIKTEYLSTMRRFFSMDYDNFIICSHEDISKAITKKSGEQITRIAPNIPEKIATKLCGMVDLVARIIVEEDGTRKISFKTDNIIFGGGRLNVTDREIPCEYDALMEIYDEANAAASKNKVVTPVETVEKVENTVETVEETVQTAEKVDEPAQTEETPEPVQAEKPVRRTRKKRD